MPHKKYLILLLLFAVYLLQQSFYPGGIMAYIYPSILWSSLAIVTLWICGVQKIQSWFSKRIFYVALVIALFQIFVLIDAGIFLSFGTTPISFTPLTIAFTSLLVISTLLGTELSRAYLIKNYGKKKPILTLALVALLYSLVSTSVFGLLTFDNPLSLSDYLGTGFLPILTENLLTTYLALLGGPIVALAYQGPLQAFRWFSPIQPNLSWGFEALIGVMVPIVGFLSVIPLLNQTTQRQLGMIRTRRRLGKKKSSIKGWLALSILGVITMWFATGLLGPRPAVIASGSMKPTMDVGDIAVIIPTPTDTIQIGDIIQYRSEGAMILHRVTDISQEGGPKLFVTRGDANPISDTGFITSQQIQGKLILIIPKLGWASIYVKTAITSIWSLFSTNTILAYVAMGTITFVASIYTIRLYKNRPHRYWRKKRAWQK